MVRAVLGVIAGYAVWSAIWLGGNAAFFAEAARVVGEGGRYDRSGPLVGVLILSIVCSLAGGAVAAAVGGPRRRVAAPVTSGALLLTGIGVQAGAWTQMPLWYHLSFLVLLVPVTLAGAMLVPKAKARA